jgi:hypothetical protein
MATTQNLFAQGINEAALAIATIGHLNTILVRGNKGQGKSALLDLVGQAHPTYAKIYFDFTTKTDSGDMGIPYFVTIGEDGERVVRTISHEELGLHLKTPIILMLDELGKAARSLKNAAGRLMYEKKFGSYELHPDSIVFATTNMTAEGLGDIIEDHHSNRITTIYLRNTTADEWIEWSINNGVDPVAITWAKDNPHAFHSWEDVTNPEDNLFIGHPKSKRPHVTTPRSLFKASNILKNRDKLTNNLTTALLNGTVGEAAGMGLMSYVTMVDQLPSAQSIKDDPMNAKVPSSAATMCMVVFRALGSIERDWSDAWMTYMGRLTPEAQGMFANGVRAKSYNPKRQQMVMTNAKFTQWAMANNHMFTADK